MPAADRRKQLIEVAINLFSQRGFGGTTTREIAAAAGVTEAIIFRHFATKQDLYKAILDDRCAAHKASEWLAEAQAFMDAKDDEGLFGFLIGVIISHHREDPAFERLLMHAALEGHELAIMHHNQLAMPVGARLMEYVAQRQAEGALRTCDPCAVIFAIAGIARFYSKQKYLYKCGDMTLNDADAAETFLSILMSGLRQPVTEGQVK